MQKQHKQLDLEKWQRLSFVEQMANIGSEVERSIKWREKGREDFLWKAFSRAVELLNLTLESNAKDASKLKEVARLKECFVDDFFGDQQYGSTDKTWRRYFHSFTFAARK